MATDLYGNSYTDNWDYARKIVTISAQDPFYKLSSFVENEKCSLLMKEEKTLMYLTSTQLSVPGLYAIFEKKNGVMRCLYCGSSNSSIYYRIYRFVKELRGVSRHDENHPAARKARKAGVDPNNIYLKFFERTRFPTLTNSAINLDTLDETCAILLKSLFNTRKKI